jgi:hypothetical protein
MTITRLRAFTLHLIISSTIFLLFLAIMFFVWYPPPYFEVDGGWQVLQIVAGVDLVLGPLLTLILFKPGKPGLKFDMTCIALMQIAAILYGGKVIYQEHPAFVVFGVDRFSSIPTADIEFDKLKYPELKRSFGIGPLLAQTRLPDDSKLREQLLFAVLEGEKDVEYRAEFYEPYKPDLSAMRSRSIPIQKIAASDAMAKAKIAAFLAQQGGQIGDYLYFPLKGKNKDMVMALSARDGMPAGFISINPWLSEYPRKPQQTPP